MAKVFSTEDGKLNSSVRVIKQRQYSDLDLSFAARTVTDGDIYKKTDAAAVKQAIKTLLLTNRFEKPYRPEFGGNLGGLLFSLADEETGSEIADRVKKSISRYEPRAEILSLRVTSTPDFNSVRVRIEFRVINTLEVDVLDLKLTEPAPAPIPIKPDPSVIPIVPVIPPEPQVNFDGMILTAAGKALITNNDEVIIRVSTVIDIEEDVQNGILTQNGLFLYTQSREFVLTTQSPLIGIDDVDNGITTESGIFLVNEAGTLVLTTETENPIDDDAITTQGGLFLYTQTGQTLMLIQGARDGFLTTEGDTINTEDGGGVPPYGGRILRLYETAPPLDSAGGFLTLDNKLLNTEDNKIILEPEY